MLSITHSGKCDTVRVLSGHRAAVVLALASR